MITEYFSNTAEFLHSESETLYEKVRGGSDFYYYQDCDNYEEHYYNPDCVLACEASKEIYWFDLDYLTAVRFSDLRGFDKNCLFRKKFVFSNKENRMGNLVMDVCERKIYAEFPLERQLLWRSGEKKPHKYVVKNNYDLFFRVQKDGKCIPFTSVALEEVWKNDLKMKIGARMGDFTLIFPVRKVFKEKEGCYNFLSKTVVIPNKGSGPFEWKNVSLGFISVCTNGSCSLFRKKAPKKFMRFLPTLVPGWKNAFVNRIRPVLGPLVEWCNPYSTENQKCTFDIFVEKRVLPAVGA